MKLPQNKKDRQKVIAGIAAGIVLALYGLWAGIYRPLVKNRDEAIAKIRKIEEQIENADKQIIRTPFLARDLLLVTSNLVNYSEQHVLHPRLGNYLIPAREIINRHTRELDLPPLQVDEIGLIALPRPRDKAPATGKKAAAPKKPAATYSMQIYGVRMAGRLGLTDLIALIRRMENENPLLAISNISITSQTGNPLVHQIVMEAQWPAWINPDYRDTLLENAGMTASEEEAE